MTNVQGGGQGRLEIEPVEIGLRNYGFQVRQLVLGGTILLFIVSNPISLFSPTYG